MRYGQVGLSELKWLINRSLKQPPKTIAKRCGDFYQPYYHLMYLLAKNLRSGVAVELGVHTGRGVSSLAAGGQGVLVIGIDTVRRNELKEVLDRFENISFYELPALPVPEWMPEINILHIDTEHSYANAKTEFEGYEPYLADGAIVLFDDMHAMEDGVKAYFDELPYEKIQDDRLHPICGYGVVIYKRTR